MNGMRVFVFAARPGDDLRAGRTLRALAGQAIVTNAVSRTPVDLAAALREGPAEPVWLVRAGAWPARAGPVAPPASATGLPLAAFGLVRGPGEEAGRWAAVQSASGGSDPPVSDLPPPASVYLEGKIAGRLAERLGAGADPGAALDAELRSTGVRLIRWPAFDVIDDERLRVLQVATSFQRGGAERIALDLTAALPRQGVWCRCVGLRRPGRTTFPIPPEAIDLSKLPAELRPDALARIVRSCAIDVVHGHLLDRGECARLAATGVPLVLTVHNMRPGWPAGLADLRREEAHLLLACSRRVESDLRRAAVAPPVRTVWNGIDFSAYAATASGSGWRQVLGLAAEDCVLLSLANPRKQKGLHRLPAILAATQHELAKRGDAREVRLVLAGAPSGSSESNQVVEEVRAEVERLGLQPSVRWAGCVEDVPGLLAACDVLVSSSLYEGFSLAHLEAVASSRPVVATAVGGLEELAHGNPAVVAVPADSGPERFAQAIAEVLTHPPLPGVTAQNARRFTRQRIAERCRWFYPQVIRRAGTVRARSGLWLVINNFSSGGAQSSARRLLLALAARGVGVRATVLQEQPDRPTAGHRALLAAGIPVTAVPPPDAGDPADSVALLLEQMALDPPESVLLWNVIAEHKLLLADGLLDGALFDVSPGEMYFTSLERYFSRPRPGLPYLHPTDYGKRLAGLIVKYHAEADRAAALGAPVHVIPNGVEPPEDLLAAGSGEDRLVLGTLARISPQKKLPDLLDALRRARDRLPPHVLRIAGGVEPGAEEHARELFRQAEGLDVEWLGGLEDPWPFLRRLDLFVLVAEPAGCPNASLEALAAGLPVIATDVGGMSEQVIDGVTGRLVARGDVAALAESIIELAHDPARRTDLGQAGREHVKRHFALTRMVEDYRRVCLGASGLFGSVLPPQAELLDQ
jgi:glycosyltransferase involved in cell wall biosynthesis